MMQYGHVRGIDKPISRLVQGTVMVSSDRLDESFELLDGIFELGCTTFDTAHVYGNGDNERTVGRWVRDRGLREQVVIIGKGAHHSQDRRRVTPFDITADIHDSLARFGFDYIDLYILHRDDPNAPVGPIVEILNEHKEAGLINAFGGSNWTHERVQAANEYAQSHGLTPFVVSSPNFSLARQVQPPWPGCVSISGPEGEDARRWYQGAGIALFTWSSLAGGFFSGRFRRDNLDSFDGYLEKLCVSSYCYEENFQRLDRVRELGEKKGLTVPQVAMAYVMSQPLNIFALTGTEHVSEFAANLEASEIRLTQAEIDWLELKCDVLKNGAESL